MPKWLTAALAFLGALVGLAPKVLPEKGAPIPEPTAPKAPAWGTIDAGEDAEVARRKGPKA